MCSRLLKAKGCNSVQFVTKSLFKIKDQMTPAYDVSAGDEETKEDPNIARNPEQQGQQEQERPHRFKVVSETRLFNAIREDSMGIGAIATVTLCTWKYNFTQLLRSALGNLLEENPILTGYIEKGTHAVTGQTGLCVVPSQYALDSIFHVVNEADGDCTHGHTANTDIDNRFLADCDLKDMMQAVSSVCGPLVPELGNGWDQKRYKSRLFAVTVVNLRRKDHSGDEGEEYAVVHIAMSHAIGDGYTYYKLIDQLNQLMKRGQITTPLRWNETVMIVDNACNSTSILRKLFFQVLLWTYFLSMMFSRILACFSKRYLPSSRFSLVNIKLCKGLKVSLNK